MLRHSLIFAAAFAVVAVMAAGPAAAITRIGFQVIYDFEDLAVGTGTITYPDDIGLGNTISGGTVALGDAAFPAHSGQKVYVATSLTIATEPDGEVTLWPAIGA